MFLCIEKKLSMKQKFECSLRDIKTILPFSTEIILENVERIRPLLKVLHILIP